MKKDKENNYISLTNELVGIFVNDEASFSIKILDSDEYDYYILVLVSEDEFKKIIGYGGKNANSIRNIIKAYAYKNGERVRIEFNSF